MAHRKIEAEIEKLSTLRDAPPGEALAVLRKALSDRVNLVVAKAAKMAAELELRELTPELLCAFNRLLDGDAAAKDPQCWGKNAVANALVGLGHRESPVYLRGMAHVQMEPVWQGQEDTAVTLRGICLLGIVACNDLTRDRILRCLVDGLAEKQHTIRLEAVRAIAQMEGDEAALLLRLKARLGDSETRVVGQVFDSLLNLEGAAAIEFVGSFLRSEAGEVVAEAALALGASRHPAALELLRTAYDETHQKDLRALLLRAISASRLEDGITFLVRIVERGRRYDVEDALEALAFHKDSAEICKRVQEAAELNGGVARELFERWFE